VVYLDKVVPGDAAGTPELIEAVKTQFAQVIGDEYAQQFTAAARIRGKVKRNEEALAKLKQELQGGGPAQ